MASALRRSLPFALGVLLILAALPAGYLLLLREPPAPVAPAPTAVRPQAVELRLGELEGLVEVRRGEVWRPAQPGEPLQVSDVVRTRAGATALLVGGPSLEVRMTPGTEVSVEELTDSLSRLLLGNGMATARVRTGSAKQTFELKAAGSDAVARTDTGTFSMSNNGQGTVAVGTQDGEVAFVGQGKVVIVRAGQQSIVRPGQGPSDPTPLPSSLLLKVQWPATGTLRRRTLVVSGQSEPGTRLEVAGQPLTPDAEGRFTQSVTLREGTNTLQVRAQGVGGVSQAEQRQVVVDTTPPRVGLDADLWK